MSEVENKRGFASDNNAGVHPAILEAIGSVNEGHVIAYGDDPYTGEAISRIQDHLGKDTGVFFVFIGTAANVLGLSSITQPYNAVICPETAHIHVDECGRCEKRHGSEHHVRPVRKTGELPDADAPIPGGRSHSI